MVLDRDDHGARRRDADFLQKTAAEGEGALAGFFEYQGPVAADTDTSTRYLARVFVRDASGSGSATGGRQALGHRVRHLAVALVDPEPGCRDRGTGTRILAAADSGRTAIGCGPVWGLKGR